MSNLRRRNCLVCVVVSLLAASAEAAPATKKAPALDDPVQKAVDALIEEANAAFQEKTQRQITVFRPHPAVKDLDAKRVHQVLHVITGKLTDNPYKDTYVRYHMMHVVNL